MSIRRDARYGIENRSVSGIAEARRAPDLVTPAEDYRCIRLNRASADFNEDILIST